MTNPLLAATLMVVEGMESGQIAAAYAGIAGFGSLAPSNLGHDRLAEASLIRPDGYPADKETLMKALEHEIDLRQKAGAF
jgi:hypothetical protein